MNPRSKVRRASRFSNPFRVESVRKRAAHVRACGSFLVRLIRGPSGLTSRGETGSAVRREVDRGSWQCRSVRRRAIVVGRSFALGVTASRRNQFPSPPIATPANISRWSSALKAAKILRRKKYEY